MKIVVPYTVIYYPTAHAVNDWTPVEWHPVDANDGYLDLLKAQFNRDDPFILCEHDMVPTGYQLDDLRDCPEDWCAYLYREEQRIIGPPLGLCRFRTPWLQANRNLFATFIRGESWTRINQWVNDHAIGTCHLHGPPFARNDARPWRTDR